MGHDQRLRRPRKYRAAPSAPTFVRWTVPQACVWIRTRDQARADNLTPDAARLIFAPGVMPGALVALDCLRVALEAGRFPMWGRPATLEFEPVGNRLLNDVDEIVPHAFWQDRGAFSIEEEIAATAYAIDRQSRPGQEGEVQDFHRRWVNLYVDRDEVIGHWQGPAQLLADGRSLTMPELMEHLRPEPEDIPAWFLCHDDVDVSGLTLNGRQSIDPPSLRSSPIEVDTDNNTLALGDLRWSAISIRLKSAAESILPTPTAEPAMTPGAPGTTAPRTIENGKPPRKRTAPLVDRLRYRKRGEELLVEIYGENCLTNGRLDNEPAKAVQTAFYMRGLDLGIEGVRRVLRRKE